MAFLGPHTFFCSCAAFGLDFTSFVIICCKAGILPLMLAVTFLIFLFMQADTCSALHGCHAYFLKNAYILYISMIAGLLKVSTKQLAHSSTKTLLLSNVYWATFNQAKNVLYPWWLLAELSSWCFNLAKISTWMTFNLSELATGWVLTWLNSLLYDF